MIKMDQEAEGIIYQICRVCKHRKPLSEFYRDKDKKLGHVSICKECHAIKSAKYYEEHKEEIVKRAKKYGAAHKLEKAAWAKQYYENHKEKTLRHQREYREDHKPEIAKYREEHKAENAEKCKRYRKTKKGRLIANCLNQHRRAQKAEAEGSGITPEAFDRIVRKQHNKCNLCGKSFCKARVATMDHIIPLSKEGDHDPSNIQALCLSCNSSKNAKIMSCFISSWAVLGSSPK
jgi:5-methylcytosine-specific restriction endonuclease McrA